MPNNPAEYVLSESPEFTEQLNRLVDNGDLPRLKEALNGVAYGLRHGAHEFPEHPSQPNLRRVKIREIGGQSAFSIWFSIDDDVVTIRGITFFNNAPLWNGD